MPLHNACYADNVTNLDFVELLLEAGADPNTQYHPGLTPLVYTIPNAPGVAKVLLNWPTTDAKMSTQNAVSFLVGVREITTCFPSQIVHPDTPDQLKHAVA
jgi:hypothetical protein